MKCIVHEYLIWHRKYYYFFIPSLRVRFNRAYVVVGQKLACSCFWFQRSWWLIVRSAHSASVRIFFLSTLLSTILFQTNHFFVFFHRWSLFYFVVVVILLFLCLIVIAVAAIVVGLLLILLFFARHCRCGCCCCCCFVVVVSPSTDDWQNSCHISN